jgi:tRNA-splicing ligase RtcB (3'-phosphate/5'-hydroxy nucleic acid ligase)
MRSDIAPLHVWLCEPMPPDVAAAIERLRRVEDVAHVAVMPDVHLAKDVCVGTVLATRRLLFPSAVGGDIGCGMLAVAFDAEAKLLVDPARAGRLLSGLYEAVPAMRRHRNRRLPWPSLLDQQPLSDASLTQRRTEGSLQLGTLGGGNHFIELQKDEDGRLRLMVHSGSRAMGQAIRDHHVGRAVPVAGGLMALDAEHPEGQAYLADVAWARAYADANRRGMVEAVAELLQRQFGVQRDEGSFISVDHNHVKQEMHLGQLLWVHRKGAMPAEAGQPGVLPGSMGTLSYHVEGRGCELALRSSAHGAGRRLSRTAARRQITSRSLCRQMAGVWFDHRRAGSLREEAPAAYKDLRAVLRAQRELVRVTRTLRPLLAYKSGG